jgi:hypothetical protein
MTPILARQSGMSLIKVFFAMVLLGALAMAALYGIRYERLPLPDSWANWIKSAPVEKVSLPEVKNLLDKPTTTEIRSCKINGKLVYSNVDCDDKNSTSKAVKIQDTAGFEAPKVPPKEDDKNQTGLSDIRAKQIEQAVNK